jgi:hypothetical protein
MSRKVFSIMVYFQFDGLYPGNGVYASDSPVLKNATIAILLNGSIQHEC